MRIPPLRVPLIPVAVLILVSAGGVGLFLMSGPADRTLGPPTSTPLVDVDGIETEVAIAPDGVRFALIASGDLWYVDLAGDVRRRLTETPVAESSPAWTGDGERITFTRGADTLEMRPTGLEATPRLEDARDLAWSVDDQAAFVRDRALWVAGSDLTGAHELVPAEANPDISIRSPRFSPSGRQILFLKSRLDLYGEVWRVDVGSGSARPVIADRPSEHPSSAEWLGDDEHLVYLTDRSGGLALWYADLAESTLLPITGTLMARAPSPLGLDVRDDRVVLPMIDIDSEIRTGEGDLLVGGPGLQMEPAVSGDLRRVAFTAERDGELQVWIVDRTTDNVDFVGLGRSPRFSPDGYQIVYASADLDGNLDIWKADTRTGLQERLTDGSEIDDRPDWSPDGRTVVFASSRDGAFSLWAVPASGGRRRRLNDGGWAPRFSPDGARVAYWRDGGIWESDTGGDLARLVADAEEPAPPVWGETGIAFVREGRLMSEEGPLLPNGEPDVWPEFDRLGETWLVSTVEVAASGLWTLELTYVEE